MPGGTLQIVGLLVVIALLVGLILQVRSNGRRPGKPAGDPAGDRDDQPRALASAHSADAGQVPTRTTPSEPRPAVTGPRSSGDDTGVEVGGSTAAGGSEATNTEVADRARQAADALITDARTRADRLTTEAEAMSRRATEAAARVRTEAADIKSAALNEADRLREEVRVERADLDRRESRFLEREERLDGERAELDQLRADLSEQAASLDERAAELDDARAHQLAELERIAGLSAEAAKAELMANVEAEARLAATQLVRDVERAAQADADRTARKIITGAIQRLASDQTAESVVSVLHLPSDEMKGRIIGREGRNVRTFEQVTGVNLIIDDTPEAVLLSCFDPVRREIGRVALEALVLDGRIHPQRIEEVVERSRGEVEQMCTRAGEDAVLEMGITDLHPELVKTLGHLKYRTSYGQNVLAHLIECGHLAAMMAAELGLDVALCRRSAFLHDIGKALTHEVEGSHALIGADLARRYGENEDVVHAIEAHHNEVEVRTVEAVLTQAADAISGGRPGARRESLESYVKRLERLEGIAHAHHGVDRVFAMQAGREVRVMVVPEEVDDIGASVLAREIAKEVEEELTYPGQIRVTVVRESRATEVAR